MCCEFKQKHVYVKKKQKKQPHIHVANQTLKAVIQTHKHTEKY